MQKYIACIFARGGSKGLLNKNILDLDGMPLIAHSIKIAKKIKKISRVYVSTDSKKIAQISLDYGAEVPFIRPKKYATDASSEFSAWKHMVEYLEKESEENIEAIISIPTTSPLRSIEDINNCIDEYEKYKPDAVITVTESNRNPFFNMVKINNDGYVSLFNESNKVYRRQDAPKSFDVTTVAYVVNVNFIKNNNFLFDGKIRMVDVPRERALDIDNKLDFLFAKHLIKLKEKK